MPFGYHGDEQEPEIKVQDLLNVASNTLQTVLGAENVRQYDLLLCPHDLTRYESELQTLHRFSATDVEPGVRNLIFKLHRVFADETIPKVNLVRVRKRDAQSTE